MQTWFENGRAHSSRKARWTSVSGAERRVRGTQKRSRSRPQSAGMAFAIRHRPNHDLIDPPRFSKQPASLDAHPRKQRSGFSSQRNVLDIAGGECWTGRVLLGRFFLFFVLFHT